MSHIFLFPVSYRRFTLFGLNLSQNNMSTNSTNQDNQGNLSETTAEIEKVSNIMRNDTLGAFKHIRTDRVKVELTVRITLIKLPFLQSFRF